MPRGSDFEARWTEGAWAELQVLEAVNAESDLFAVQFGITDGTAFWSLREMEARDLPDQSGHGKRPDILVFRRNDLPDADVAAAGKLMLLSDKEADSLAQCAVMAVETEFSPYAYKHRLEQYGKELSFTIKDEDLRPLTTWHEHFFIPLGIVQVYLDSTYFLSFDTLLEGISAGTIRKQHERAYGKAVYYPPMSTGIPFAEYVEFPTIEAEVILDKYGKYTAYRKVIGGKLHLTEGMRELLK
jgi:hypothetical protein